MRGPRMSASRNSTPKGKTMAKGQVRSNKEKRKPKADKKKKGLGIAPGAPASKG